MGFLLFKKKYFPTRDWAERVIVISYDIYNGPLKKKRKGGGGGGGGGGEQSQQTI